MEDDEGLDKEVLQNALNSLSKRDRDIIQALSLDVEQTIKAKRGSRKIMFGYWSALEVIAAGIIYKTRGKSWKDVMLEEEKKK